MLGFAILRQISILSSQWFKIQKIEKEDFKSEKLIDAPEAVVQIRNAIVHSQEEKRAKLNKIENMAKYEALQVCIWYIEVALLKILDYKGDYTNRCSEQIVRSAKREKLL